MTTRSARSARHQQRKDTLARDQSNWFLHDATANLSAIEIFFRFSRFFDFRQRTTYVFNVPFGRLGQSERRSAPAGREGLSPNQRAASSHRAMEICVGRDCRKSAEAIVDPR